MTGTEDQIGGFDIICRGSVIKYPSNYTYGTLLGKYLLLSLGANNNREKNLKGLAKSAAQRLAQNYLQKNLNASKK
jgi:tubulin polyglutamylase TTLL9